MLGFWFFWVDAIVHFKQPGKGVTRDQAGSAIGSVMGNWSSASRILLSSHSNT
jgi:hypothetical protein